MERTKFPYNVHSEFQDKTEGINAETKRGIIKVVIGSMIATVTWLSWTMFSGTPFVILGTIATLVLSVIAAVLIWNKFFVDKELEAFEDKTGNKIFRFFNLSLAEENSDMELKDGTEVLRYVTGEKAISFSFTIGNNTPMGESITEEFLDKLFYLVHVNKLRMKIFTDKQPWEGSTMHRKFLRRISLSNDARLRETLIDIDKHQSVIFSKNYIPRVTMILLMKGNKMKELQVIADFINSWYDENKNLTNVRELVWETCLSSLAIMCQYLGTKTLEVSPLADKEKTIALDTRLMVSPHNVDGFFNSRQVELSLVDTNSQIYRQSKYSKARRRRQS